MKFHYLRRYKLDGGQTLDLGIVDIPENQVAETLRANPLWEDLGVIGEETKEVKEEPKEIKPEGLECPLCGFMAKNEKSLRMHKMKAHK